MTTLQVTSASAAPGAAAAPAHAPLPLKSADPTTRELALAAQRFARAAKRQPGDFEAVYNHGLALQELATRAGASRAEQLRLLAEARCTWPASFSPQPVLPSVLGRCKLAGFARGISSCSVKAAESSTAVKLTT